MKGKTLRLGDRVIGSFLYSAHSAKKVEKCPCGKNLLAIKLWAIGESVLILPALRALKNMGYKVRVLATKQNKDVFVGLDFVDEVIVMDTNPAKYSKTMRYIKDKEIDVAIDFEPYTKMSAVIAHKSGAKRIIGFDNRPKLYTDTVAPIESIHAVKNFMNLVNVLHRVRYPERLEKLAFSRADEKNAGLILKSFGVKNSDKLIGMHAGSASSSLTRRWPESRFAELADALVNRYNVKIVLVGSDSEKKINKSVITSARSKSNIFDLSGKLKLKELFALMKHLDLFIANDSGPMHIAAAMGVKTIGLFGPNLPERYGPYGKKNIGLYKGSGVAAVMPFRGVFKENNEINKIFVNDVLGAVKSLNVL